MILHKRPHSSNRWQPPFNREARLEDFEETLNRGELQIEQKIFTLTLKENARGRFLRIVERSGDFHLSVIIPATGLADFYNVLAQLVAADKEFPPASQPGL